MAIGKNISSTNIWEFPMPLWYDKSLRFRFYHCGKGNLQKWHLAKLSNHANLRQFYCLSTNMLGILGILGIISILLFFAWASHLYLGFVVLYFVAIHKGVFQAQVVFYYGKKNKNRVKNNSLILVGSKWTISKLSRIVLNCLRLFKGRAALLAAQNLKQFKQFNII